MEITDFIRRRLFDMDRVSEYSQMNVNGLNVNKHLDMDAQAVRRLLQHADHMEKLSNESGSLNGVGYAAHTRKIIASRWRSHKDFKEEWLSH